MKKNFVPKTFNNFVIALVPKDTNVEMTEDGYFFLSKENSWSFDNLSKFIRKIPKVSQDSSCKPGWSSFDYKNFFSFVFDGGEKIVFEIDASDCVLQIYYTRRSKRV